jgi:hypothetical protein
VCGSVGIGSGTAKPVGSILIGQDLPIVIGYIFPSRATD